MELRVTIPQNSYILKWTQINLFRLDSKRLIKPPLKFQPVLFAGYWSFSSFANIKFTDFSNERLAHFAILYAAINNSLPIIGSEVALPLVSTTSKGTGTSEYSHCRFLIIILKRKSQDFDSSLYALKCWVI